MTSANPASDERSTNRPFVVVLGVAQDGGYPQAGCDMPCCNRAWSEPALERRVACLGVVDPLTRGAWLVDATPDLPSQMHSLRTHGTTDGQYSLEGILLTHAHTGHYTGLMHLGKEAAAMHMVPVYAMPRVANFLTTNAPWNRLVDDRNIDIRPIASDTPVCLTDRLQAEPFLVVHRAETSETVGFRLTTDSRTVTYLPDIDHLDGWSVSIEDELEAVDRMYLDGTFYGAGELPGRDMAEIRHPLVSDVLRRLEPLPPHIRQRLRLTHLNHTNPLLQPNSPQAHAVADAGLAVAAEGETCSL